MIHNYGLVLARKSLAQCRPLPFAFVGCLSALTLPSTAIELGFQELIENVDRMSKLGLTLFISVLSAMFATAFTFPGFRTAQMNKDSANNVRSFLLEYNEWIQRSLCCKIHQ